MSSKPPKNTTTTTQQVFSPEETKARGQLFDAGAAAFDQQQNALSGMSNPASVPVGQSAATTQAQGMLTNYATGAGANTAGQMSGAIDYGLNGAMDVNNNPHLAGAMDAATQGLTRAYTDPNGVLANIRSDAVGNGQYGGTRQGLGEGVAAGRYLSEVGNITSNMGSAAFDKGQDTFARTLGLAPSAMQAGLMPAQALSAVGAQQEGYAQMLNDYEASGRMFELNKPFGAVANYANLINGIAAPGTTATNDVGNGGSSKAMSALGGGLSGAMAGAPMGPWGMAIGGGLGVLSGLF